MREITTRAQARERGSLTYFTGEPCIHGHVAERRVDNGCCRECVLIAKQTKRSKRPGYRTRAEMDAARDAPTRRCKACGEELPATSEFFVTVRNKEKGWSGLATECRDCRNKRFGPYYEENREELIARATAQTNARRQTPEGREKERVWARDGARRRSADPKKRARKTRVQRAYNKKNPEVFMASRAKRRARLLEAEGAYTATDVRKQYAKQRGRCFWCKEEVGDDYHVDHYVPLSRGGSNWPSNIRIACSSCNLSKHDKLPEEFRAYLAEVALLAQAPAAGSIEST